MRKTAFIVAALAAMLLIASSAQAISKGPGGRLYIAGRNSDGNAIVLYSLTIDENWDNTIMSFVQHGEIRDADPAGRKRYSGSSPEIQTFAGTGYGQIVIGVNYDNSPAATFTDETMDVLRVTPSDAGMSIEKLGDGKAIPDDGHSNWYHRNSSSTEGGRFAIPDPNGELMGDSTAVITQSGAYNYNTAVNVDTYGDGDLTDNDADYLYQTYRNGFGNSEDYEIFDGKLWGSSSYGPLGDGYDGIFYLQTEPDNTLSRHAFYYDYTGDSGIGDENSGPLDYSGFGLAVGEVQGHTAAWGVTHDPDCGTWGTNLLTLFIDLNDDGDALDNADVTGSIDEYQWIYSNSSAAGPWNNVASSWSDLELITNENGTMFLLVQNEFNNWAYGRTLWVMELADNGAYVGGNDGVKLIADEKQLGFLFPGTNYRETEFDAVSGPTQIPGDANGDGKVDGTDLAIWQQNYDPLGDNGTFATGDWNGDGKVDGTDLALWQQYYDPLGTGGLDGLGGSVPEPATLLLLGTGLAGGIGFIRRRRMK